MRSLFDDIGIGMLAEGIDVPMELLGGYQRRVATVETKKR